MGNIFGPQKPLKDIVRENQRMINKVSIHIFLIYLFSCSANDRQFVNSTEKLRILKEAPKN